MDAASENTAGPRMVYLPEWLIFYTSRGRGSVGWAECLEWFKEHYEGKIRNTDWRIANSDGQTGPAMRETYRGRWRVQLRVPNLRGICRDEPDADEIADQLGQDAVAVLRFSAEERKLLRYGKSLIREP